MRLLFSIVLTAVAGCTSLSSPESRTLPHDPVHDAIYARFGNPDRSTGSGRGFYHYDLANHQTVILIVSGDKIIGVDVSDGERDVSQPEDAAYSESAGAAAE